MPGYPWLERTPLDPGQMQDHLRLQAMLGVPYSEGMIAAAASDTVTQGTNFPEDEDGLLARYPNANVRAFTDTAAAGARLTEADALIAYLQSLGTAIDFALYDHKTDIR